MLWFCASCTDPPDCFVTDQTSYLDSKEYSGKSYYLYYRLTGWQDKAESLYLYDQEPDFDSCGKTDTGEIFATDIGPDSEANVLTVTLQPDGRDVSSELLLIVYSDNPNEGFKDARDIRFFE